MTYHTRELHVAALAMLSAPQQEEARRKLGEAFGLTRAQDLPSIAALIAGASIEQLARVIQAVGLSETATATTIRALFEGLMIGQARRGQMPSEDMRAWLPGVTPADVLAWVYEGFRPLYELRENPNGSTVLTGVIYLIVPMRLAVKGEIPPGFAVTSVPDAIRVGKRALEMRRQYGGLFPIWPAPQMRICAWDKEDYSPTYIARGDEMSWGPDPFTVHVDPPERRRDDGRKSPTHVLLVSR
jgi:hypothetical protein